MKKDILAPLVFIVFFLSGCAALDKKDNDMTMQALLEPQAVMKFGDIPVPAGFKLIPQQSYSFQNTGIRVGLLKYEGKAGVDQVMSFYKEQMPIYNWNLINIIEYGDRIMNFDRESETCIITLLPKGSKVMITLAVGPRAQTPRKSDKSVK